MTKELLLYLFPNLISTPVSIGLAIYAWQRKNVHGSATFALLMANVALWSLLTLGFELSGTYQSALIWYRLRYLSIATVPTQVFLFGLQFSGRTRHLRPIWLFALFIIPLLTQILLWFVPGFVVNEVTFRREGLITVMESDTIGPWFLIHFAYSFLSVLAGLVIVILYGLQSAHLYRWQAAALVAGGLPLFIISAVLATFVESSYALLAPIGFLIMGIVYLWALFRYKLLDMSSISRTLLVDRMGEGVMVLDSANRVADINLSGAALIEKTPREIIGQPLPSLWPELYSAIDQEAPRKNKELEISIGRSDERRRWFNVKTSEISTGVRKNSGILFIFADISEQKFAQEALAKMNRNLEHMVSERTSTLEQRTMQLEAISHILSELRLAETAHQFSTTLVHEVRSALNAEAAAIFLLDSRQNLILEAVNGLAETGGTGGAVLRLAELRTLLKGTSPQNIPSHWAVERLNLLHGWSLDETASLFVSPIIASQKWQGVLFVVYRQPIDSLSTSETQILEAVSAMAGNALSRIILHTSMKQMALRRRFQLAILYEITAIANDHAQLTVVLALILKNTLRLNPIRAGLVCLWDEEQGFNIIAAQGLDEVYLEALTGQAAIETFFREVLEAGKPVTWRAGECALLELPQNSALLGLQIARQGVRLGSLCVAVDSETPVSDEDLELFRAIADQIGIAVENSQLRAQAEEAAVMLERQRLARELHDSVTQSLYGSVLLGEAGLNSFAAMQVQDAHDALQRIVEVSRQALKEMRLLIYELKPLDLSDLGFREAVHQRLESVEKRADIQTYFDCDPEIEPSGTIAVNLYRILQEALNNVLKHSSATQVKVELSADQQNFYLTVKDNGTGFDVPAAIKNGGLGISGMRERIGVLGGKLLIRSFPGEGTTLVMNCPRGLQEIP